MASIVISGSTSGTVTVSAPAVSGSNTITLPATTGTAATLGTTLTQGTAQATTSGTSIDFTSIPSWVKRITIMFQGVSTSGTSTVQVQIGSGSVTTSGYLSTAFGSSTTSVANTGSTSGFPVEDAGLATYTRGGIMTICNLTSNTWIYQSSILRASGVISMGAGSIALSGILDRVRITTVNGTDTFDAGSINIMYEG